MNAIVANIRRYPVKGLNGQNLPSVSLETGGAIPWDRRFGLLHGPAALDTTYEGWRPASDFFTLDRVERLALLDSEFDATTGSLIIRRAGKPVSRGKLDLPMGKMLLEQFFSAYLSGAAPGVPKLAEATGFSYAEREDAPIILANLASIRDLEDRVAKQPIDPQRFRANLYLDGVPPWAERNWAGRRLRIGSVILHIASLAEYRPAFDVNPRTGVRDLSLLPVMRRGLGHAHCGLYARVEHGGDLAAGTEVTLLDD